MLLAACSKSSGTSSATTTSTAGASTTSTGSTATSSAAGLTTTTTTGATTTSAATPSNVTLAPEMTEGPYYLDLDLVRGDIREDRRGATLDLDLIVMDVAQQGPIIDLSGKSQNCAFNQANQTCG